MPIYTKTGDSGTTGIFGGERVLKSDVQIEAYGTIDELTSFIGLLENKLGEEKEQRHLLIIQRDLYHIMGILAGSNQPIEKIFGRVKEFEHMINVIEQELPKLTQFVLPQGGEIASLYHIVRTITRRAERRLVDFFSSLKKIEEKESLIILQYINRLSDLFFVLARKYTEKEIKTKEV